MMNTMIIHTVFSRYFFSLLGMIIMKWHGIMSMLACQCQHLAQSATVLKSSLIEMTRMTANSLGALPYTCTSLAVSQVYLIYIAQNYNLITSLGIEQYSERHLMTSKKEKKENPPKTLWQGKSASILTQHISPGYAFPLQQEYLLENLFLTDDALVMSGGQKRSCKGLPFCNTIEEMVLTKTWLIRW